MKDAFYLILRNPVLFAITGGLSKLFAFFGMLFITAATTVSGYAIIQHTEGKDLQSAWAPLLVILLIGYIIANLFMDIWSMAADTLLQCLCVDKELNQNSVGAQKGDGSIQSLQAQYNSLNTYCPKQLLELVQDGAHAGKVKELQEQIANKKKMWQ